MPGRPKSAPAYAIASVDHVLRLIVVLRTCGPIRVADAAARLGVAPSTAHRLLAMLVYREFAVQQDDRRYAAGPALGVVEPTPAPPQAGERETGDRETGEREAGEREAGEREASPRPG